jgi:GntR family transcriptional regulator
MPWDERDLEDGPVPMWFQIAERLRSEIEKGSFKAGDSLPPESALIRRFGVSRTTARSALDQLEHEQLISRRSGRGSIVLPPRVDQPLNLLASFSEDMRARGLTPSFRTLGVSSGGATAEVSSNLDVERGSRVIVVERILCADGSPIALSKAWLPPAVLGNHTLPTVDELDSGSMYTWLEQTCGVRIALGDEFIEAAVADQVLADSLEIAVGAPVLCARRRSRSMSGQVVEYVVLHYRADRYRFRVELARP